MENKAQWVLNKKLKEQYKKKVSAIIDDTVEQLHKIKAKQQKTDLTEQEKADLVKSIDNKIYSGTCMIHAVVNAALSKQLSDNTKNAHDTITSQKHTELYNAISSMHIQYKAKIQKIQGIIQQQNQFKANVTTSQKVTNTLKKLVISAIFGGVGASAGLFASIAGTDIVKMFIARTNNENIANNILDVLSGVPTKFSDVVQNTFEHYIKDPIKFLSNIDPSTLGIPSNINLSELNTSNIGNLIEKITPNINDVGAITDYAKAHIVSGVIAFVTVTCLLFAAKKGLEVQMFKSSAEQTIESQSNNISYCKKEMLVIADKILDLQLELQKDVEKSTDINLG